MIDWRVTRRQVLVGSGVAALVIAAVSKTVGIAKAKSMMKETKTPDAYTTAFTVNGEKKTVTLDARTTLLDTLREELKLTGTKKGCDHGQCGACTVLVDGRRINSCLTLAVMHEGAEITTIEGLGQPENLHPMQAAFVAHDGFQCGYCTPGQICSAVGMVKEFEDGMPSHVSADLEHVEFSDGEIQERMSGNLCRCAAYPNILAAIKDARDGTTAKMKSAA